MQSESARMSSAAEARFRIQTPSAVRRVAKIVALDAESEGVIRHLATASWNQATFFTAATFVRHLEDEVATADLVVMVATPGGHAGIASRIGQACSASHVMATTLVVGAASASDEELSRTLAQVRPWSLMVVIAHGDDYIHDMLTSLRA